MSRIHSQWKQIPEFEISDMQHVDHQNYIRWMREMTHDHYTALGFSRDYFVDIGKCFVVRRHSVEHLSPCFLNDTLLLATWISEVGKKAVKRMHRIFKVTPSGECIPVVSAETLSIFVDIKVKPTAIPEEIKDKLVVVPVYEAEKYIRALAANPELA